MLCRQVNIFFFLLAAAFILCAPKAVSHAAGAEGGGGIAPYDSEEVTLNLEVAEDALTAGDLDGALVAYSRAYMLDPESYPAAYNLGYISYLRGKTDDAERYFRIASRTGAARTEPLLGLGSVLLLKNDTAGAIRCFSDALKIDVDCADARFNLAEAYAAEKKYAKAFEILSGILKEAGKNKKDESDAALKLAAVCVELEKYEEAAAALSKADPANYEGVIEKFYLKGIVCRKTGSAKEAESAFAMAKEAAEKSGSPSLVTLLEDKMAGREPIVKKGRISEGRGPAGSRIRE